MATVIPKFITRTRANFGLGGGDLFGTAAMIGLSSWGEVGTMQEFSTFTELNEYYKSGQIVDAGEQFYLGGGTTLKVVRVAGTDKAKATIQLLNGATPAIQLDAKYYGSYGNNIYVTVTANADTPANRDLEIGDGTTTETYTDLASNTLIVAALSSSVLIDATKLTDDLIDSASKAFLTTGDDGDTVVTSDYTTLLTDVLFTKDWDYLTIPGQTTDAFHTTMAAQMINRENQENRYSLFVSGVDKFEAIATTTARTATGERLIRCHTAQWDGTNDITLTGSWRDATYTAAMLTGLMCALPVNTSPTNKTMPMTGGRTLAENDYSSSQKNTLSEAGFIVIDKTQSSNYGVILGVTGIGSTTVWNYSLDAVRKVDYIKDEIYNQTKNYFGTPNDDITRRAIRSTVNAFLTDTKRDRIIEEYEIEVLKGTDPREVVLNVSVWLIYETTKITFTLTLNI